MNALTFDIVFLSVVTVCAVIYWAALVGDVIKDRNKLARARKNKQHNNKSAKLTYGDESHAEVERMYREAGLIK
jgi:hypothetical protein